MAATPSQVKTGLDDLAKTIAAQRVVLMKCKQNAQAAAEILGSLPTAYAELVSTIQGYASEDAFESYAKAMWAALADEYGVLKASAEQMANADL